MKPSILILNGPNLNLIENREPTLYGHKTLADIRRECAKHAASIGSEIEFLQSNHEGSLVDAIQAAAPDGRKGIILNAGAYTHTSIAILDALLACPLPCIEVHLSNIHARETYRQKSVIASGTIGHISGFGSASYTIALSAMTNHLREKLSELKTDFKKAVST